MNKLVLYIVIGACALLKPLWAQSPPPHLESPYYVFPRAAAQHLDLSKNWQLSSEEDTIQTLDDLANNDWFNVAYPTSVQMAYYQAGKLKNPYEHQNALEYEKLEQKAWYYKRSFSGKPMAHGERAILCFDGIDYFAKVWVNKQLIGTHRGIFGGPTIDITDKIIANGTNEIIVEVLSANFKNTSFNGRQPGKIVKGWFLTGGSGMEPFFNLGLWRDVRIEFRSDYHLERPFLFTKSIDKGKATIGLSLELFSGKEPTDLQLHPWQNQQIQSSTYFPKTGKQNNRTTDEVAVTIRFLDDNKTVFTKKFQPTVIVGRSFLEDELTIENPKLWFPNGMGNPDLYHVQVSLQVNGKTVDNIGFDFGIRTIQQVRSAGVRTEDRWQNWQFVVNGKKLFIKGINWMPVDALYDLTPDKYDWAVRMAKNAGIQLFRVWGSALLESKTFYDACNKYGIMVWQDFNIANFETPDWPQEVWEAQVCQNIFRLRNEPSLAVWCGGNEFNPYAYGNAASIGIVERNLAIFDPSRMFVRASPDNGSLHSYPDFDPRWYRSFDLTPFIAETGIHSITDSQGIQEVIDAQELKDLSGMYEEDFRALHPEFVMHFAEYSPGRVPRMLSRASHLDDMHKPSLAAIAEASQISAGEFYQVMSEAIQSNYPITTGLMPWVYKRPWPVVAAIHLVDGFGQPSAPYYFLKRTYAPTRVTVQVDRLLWGPGETFPLTIKMLNGVNQPAFKGKVRLQILDDSFKQLWSDEVSVNLPAETAVSSLTMHAFSIPKAYKSRYFFVLAQLHDQAGRLVSQADYWPRTIPQMEDSTYRAKFISAPVEWPTLVHGPWLKPSVAKSKTRLDLSIANVVQADDGLLGIDVVIKNSGKLPSFMTRLEIEGIKRLFFVDDNFFWLQPGETRHIHLELKAREEIRNKQAFLVLSSWNAPINKKEIILDKLNKSPIQ